MLSDCWTRMGSIPRPDGGGQDVGTSHLPKVSDHQREWAPEGFELSLERNVPSPGEGTSSSFLETTCEYVVRSAVMIACSLVGIVV